MIDQAKAAARWTIARMQEPSTWAGIAAMSALAHHQLEPGYAQSLCTAGTVAGGLLASALSERIK